MLADDMGRFFADPLGFVMYAFEWDADRSLQMVELPEPWASKYKCKWGPDKWACEFLDDIGRQVKDNGFDGRNAVDPIREAVSSGHGIGKSSMSAWLTLWIMSTRPYSKGTITANTSNQLEAKTWAEIAKWNRRSITGHWFSVSTGRGSMRIVHNDHPESWRCDAQTCRKENSEAFAGQHAADSTSWYLFDEASAVPDQIWDVAEGGLTDGEPMIFAFGNPTRNSGRFFDLFHKLRTIWNTRRVDSRDVQITNKRSIQAWADLYGENSDFFRVRVRGEFPMSSSTQLVPVDVVDAAVAREAVAQSHDPLVMGVDVARFGDDQSVISLRRGRDAQSYRWRKYQGMDTVQLAGRVIEVLREQRAIGDPVDAVFVDGGGVGGGVVDYLRSLGHDVHEVNFGSRPRNARYRDRRAEMWVEMRDWLRDEGAIPDDQELRDDLISPEYGYMPRDNKLFLESKDDMKRRGIQSPDVADALALTFASPVGQRDGWPGYHESGANLHESEYDPFATV